jgi:hypothetical protein
MKKVILLVAVGMFTLVSCKKEGCTDTTATNYSESANKDDGSCVYEQLINPADTSNNTTEFPLTLYAGIEDGGYGYNSWDVKIIFINSTSNERIDSLQTSYSNAWDGTNNASFISFQTHANLDDNYRIELYNPATEELLTSLDMHYAYDSEDNYYYESLYGYVELSNIEVEIDAHEDVLDDDLISQAHTLIWIER